MSGPSVTLTIVLSVIVVFLALIWGKTHGVVVLDLNKPMEFASILLTAAAVVLTGVAVAVAVVTLYGFQSIKSAAVAAAETEARRVAADTAESVASRTAREAVQGLLPAPPPEEGDKIAEASAEDSDVRRKG